MKHQIKNFLLATGLFCSINTQAQNRVHQQFMTPPPALGTSYNTAIGLRGGETSGLTIKHFFGGSAAIEGIIGLWHHGFTLTALYENHTSAFGVAGLNWYYGAGGHFSARTNSSYYGWGHRRNDYYDNDNFGLGVDGIVGLEFKIPQVPVALSLDLKPFIEVISNGRIYGSLDPGIGVKFTL